MPTAERLNVSIPADLADRMRAAGLSPSELLQEILRDRLGDEKVLPVRELLAQLDAAHRALGSRVAKLERAAKAVSRLVKTETDTTVRYHTEPVGDATVTATDERAEFMTTPRRRRSQSA